MSNVALTWAFPIPITGPRKAVLIAMAEHADDVGVCWPSIARLVLFSGVGERAVRYALRDLEEAKLIATDRSNGRVSSRYKLALNAAYDAGLDGSGTQHDMQGRGETNRHDVQDNRTSDPAPHAATRHDVQGYEEVNPACGAVQPGMTCINPAPHAVNPAPHAPEPSRTLKEPSERTPIPPVRAARSDDTKAIADAVEIWNDVCGLKLPAVQKLTDQRKKAIAARIREDFAGDVENWRACCEIIVASTFLTTGNGTWPGATFDWVMKPSNMTKILEGNFTDRPAAKAPAKPADKFAWLDEPIRQPNFDLEMTPDVHGTFRPN